MSAANTRLIVVHRWGGRPDVDFYPWLRRELARRRPPLFDEVRVPVMPDPDRPTIEGWVSTLDDVIGRPTPALERTYLLGHSVGCQAVLRWLSRLPAGHHVAGVLLVAAWWAVDEPWDTIRPWMETPFDVSAARRAAGDVRVLLSDTDPFTADQAAAKAAFEAKLGADVQVEADRAHFNDEREPAVLSALQSLAGAS